MHLKPLNYSTKCSSKKTILITTLNKSVLVSETALLFKLTQLIIFLDTVHNSTNNNLVIPLLQLDFQKSQTQVSINHRKIF